MMISTSDSLRKLRYSSSMMITSVTGTSSNSRSFARTMYSYWPDQAME